MFELLSTDPEAYITPLLQHVYLQVTKTEEASAEFLLKYTELKFSVIFGVILHTPPLLLLEKCQMFI